MQSIFTATVSILTVVIFSGSAALAQTDYEKCIADATTGAEQTRCALTNG
jgi:hypothetical protein